MPLRVYLLNPASYNVLASRRYAEFEPALMPMGLCYLGAVLRERGHEVIIHDQAATTLSNEALLADIEKATPELLGISILTGAWHNVVILLREILDRWPTLPVVMGNTHATVYVDDILREGYSDFVIHGEGETSMLDLVETLERKEDLTKVPGLSWYDGSDVFNNPTRPPIQDLDSLPYPAWDLLDLKAWRYQKVPMVNLHSHPVPIMASRGCPYTCSFCSQNGSNRTFRRRKVSRVVEEIGYMVEQLGFRSFGFNDSYFPWDKQTGLEFCDRMRSTPWHKSVKWVTQTRVDRIDDELMMEMRSAGLHAIMFGFESGNHHVLNTIQKKTTVQQGSNAIRVAHRHGVLVIGFFMLGLPGESAYSIEDTIRFAIDNDVDIAKFAITIPYPGSELYRQHFRRKPSLEECDRFTSWFDWTGRSEPPIWSPDGMSGEELVWLQRVGMARFYMRPSYIWRALRTGLFSMKEVILGGYLLVSRLARKRAS